MAARRSAAGGGTLQGETHALSYDSESEDCRWTFARLALKPDALLLTCNSRQRADMAKMKLAGVLDGLIGQPLMSMQTLEQAMADSRAKRSEEDVAAETVPPHRGSVASAVHG